MKKILLTCLIALGIGAQAQVTIFSDDFETATSGTRGGWEFGWFGTATALPAARNDFFIRSSADCSTSSPNGAGNHLQIVRTSSATAIANCLYGAQTNSSYSPLIYKEVDASNYKDLNISFKWVSGGQVASGTPTDYGFVVFSTDGTSWGPIEDDPTLFQGATTAQVLNVPIPEEVNFTKFYIGFRWFANGTTHNAPSLGVDDIVVTGVEPSVIPTCTTITSPLDGATIDAGTLNINWSSSPDASAYKVTVGTTSGGSDVYNSTVSGLSASVPVNVSTTYYINVVPTNAIGDAVGCQEISVTTNNTITYCTPTRTNGADELITKVVFSDINKTSTATVAYENFTTTIGNVKRESTYPATVTVNPFYNGDQTVIWIDYDQNGSFTDNEKTILTGTGTATGNITIPADAKLGNTRMRVRLHYNSPVVVLQPCGATPYGQTEDYTVTIAEATMAVTDTTKSGVAVYPNPFVDVLKITDVKGVKSITINDASGRSVRKVAASNEVNLSSLKAGLYIVNLHMEDGTVKSFKAIKK